MIKPFKPLTLGFLIFIPFVLTSCWNAQPEGNQNTIGSTLATYEAITEASTSLKSSVTSEQKNISLPDGYSTNVCSITTAGNYYFTGSLTEPISIAKSLGEVHIYLEDVDLSVSANNAISSKKETDLIITLMGTNTLSNTGKAKHVIDCKENLTINGNGILNINSTKSGITTDKTFFGLGGTFNVIAANHAINAETIYLNSTTINALSCGKDVLHAESDYDAVEVAPDFSFECGFVYVATATINTTTILGDGIQADSFVYIEDGSFDIKTTPTWCEYVAEVDKQQGMFDANTHQKVAKDNVRAGETYVVLKDSCKGIKAGDIDYYLSSDVNQENELTVINKDYAVLIVGGVFDIDTTDNALNSKSGSVFIYGGDLTINTSEDGIHAGNHVKIGGETIINIETSYEGIEGQTIEITSGDITVNALDDGINATNANLSKEEQKSICQINVSGGRLDVTVNPNGDRDGIDSNGGIKISDGVVIVRGPNNENACPLDAAKTIYINGGVVIVIGRAPGSPRSGEVPNRPSGHSEGSFLTTLTKTQSSTNGLSIGEHTVTLSNSIISYYNQYTYSGNTTVYARESVTID